MSGIPKAYAWLGREPGPNMLMHGISLLGTVEFAGTKDNPLIMAWAAEVGYDKVYTHDAIPWCGLIMAVCAKRAGWDYHPNNNALYALNWAQWGTPVSVDQAALGDVGVWKRKGGGHVGQIIAYDSQGFYHVLGGNQSDQCSIVRKPMSGVVAVRRAPWRLAQPANIRRIKIAAGGTPVSTNEA